jgi:hypothetical protein
MFSGYKSVVRATRSIVDNVASMPLSLYPPSRSEEAGETPARSRHCIRSASPLTAESQTLLVIGSTLTGRAIPGG